MDLMWIKLILTPLFITAIALAGRRWGPAVGGWIAGLPLTSGPVSVYLALEQGREFASASAAASLAGGIAVAAFCLAYGVTAVRRSWVGSTAAGLSAFLAVALLLHGAPLSLWTAFGGLLLALFGVRRFLPFPDRQACGVEMPWWDLPARAVAATALVLLLTRGATVLGPRWSGLLSPFPLFANVTAAFAHRHEGAAGGLLALRGIATALLAFAVFFLVVGGMLPRLGAGWTYPVAAAGAAVVNGLLLRGLRGTVEVD